MRFASILIISCALIAPAFAQNQDAPANDPQSELQQMRMQIFQNMVAKGIDPQEFFGQIRQQMQDGTFDPAQLQKMLIDKGVLDEKTANRMQALTQSATLSRIREQLVATDAEWTVIQPKVLKVLSAMSDVAPPGQAGGMRMMLGAAGGSAAISKATRELRAAINDPKTSDYTIDLRLRAWRDAHEKAKSDLAAAQKELTGVLTTRQEAILSNLGLLP
jgi:hypothetical protein